MKKDAPYFPHDMNAHSDPKMIVLLSETGPAGTGIYWIIIEILHQEPEGKITYQAYKQYIRFYTKIIGMPEYQVDQIEHMLITCGLLLNENEHVFSNRVFCNKKERDSLSEKRQKAGKASAEARRQKSENQSTRTHVEQVLNKPEHLLNNKIKEKKIRENKIQEIPKEEIVVDKHPVYNKFFEMFRRASGSHITDAELLHEIGKFENKYPNIHPNQAGPLINAWAGNIGKDMGKSWQKEPELSDYQKKYQEEIAKRKNSSSGVG